MKKAPAFNKCFFWRRARDSIRASADAWSLAVTTVHRTVALYRSSFESRSSDFIEKIKGSTLWHYLPFFGGEQGIRTLEAVLRLTRVPVVLLRPTRTTLHMLYCLAIIHEQGIKIKTFCNLFFYSDYSFACPSLAFWYASRGSPL